MANDADRTFEKWGETARAGFQTVPDLLLKKQADLGLSATDMLVLLNITSHWWYKGQRAFPHNSTICGRMGVDERTVQRSVKKLISLKLMEKVKESDAKGGERTVCDFTGLVERLGQFVGSDKDYMARKRQQSIVEPSSFNMEL